MTDDEIVAEDREPFEAVAIKFGDDLRTANVESDPRSGKGFGTVEEVHRQTASRS